MGIVGNLWSNQLLSSSVLTMTSINPIDCSAFRIAGHIACMTTGKMATVQGALGLNLRITSLVSYINGALYLFQGGEQPQDYSQAAAIFGQMLSSFKPTKQNATIRSLTTLGQFIHL